MNRRGNHIVAVALAVAVVSSIAPAPSAAEADPGVRELDGPCDNDENEIDLGVVRPAASVGSGQTSSRIFTPGCLTDGTWAVLAAGIGY